MRTYGPWSTWVVATATPADEPLTVDELIARSRTLPGDVEPELLEQYITEARVKVEADTDLILVPQTVRFLHTGLVTGPLLMLPRPVRELIALEYVTEGGAFAAADPGAVLLGPQSILFTARGPVTVRLDAVVSDFAVGDVPPGLKHAVGLLATHYLTQGRDATVVGTIVQEMLLGYDDAINQYRVLWLA